MAEHDTYKKLARVRAPRVHITYALESGAAAEERELPFVIAVLADLAGDASSPRPLGERRFLRVDLDSFDEVMRCIGPSVDVELPSGRVQLGFQSMSDFEPRALVERLRAVGGGAGEGHLVEGLALVLGDAGFRGLEAAWRSLRYLVTQTESGPSLWIEVLHVTKKELWRDLSRAAEFDQSLLVKKIYEERFGAIGGTPFGLIVGGYEFSHEPPDIELLMGLAGVASLALAPFVAQASPGLLGFVSFEELDLVRSATDIFMAAEYAHWRSFRDSEDARWVALTVPRVLLRRPHVWPDHGRAPASFREVEEGRREGLLWGSSAFTLAARISAAFAREGWTARIQGMEGGGLVEDLPTWTATGPGGAQVKFCTDYAITDRREAELHDLGIVALVTVRESDRAVFFSVPSCHRPRVFEDAAASRSARVVSRLPTLLACARFAQYLKVICRERMGSYHERGDYQRLLQEWIARYVGGEAATSAEAIARFPLRDAHVEVLDLPGRPGRLRAVVHLRPRLQVAELEVSVRMVVDPLV